MTVEMVGYLETRGFKSEAADVYGTFIQSAVHLLALAHSSLIEDSEWSIFIKLDGALGKLRAKNPHKGFRLPLEEALTQELVKRMQNIYGADPSSWQSLFQHHPKFACDPAILTGKRRGKKARRCDIEISSMRPNGPSLFCEAKVLEAKNHVNERLLGAEGVECFRDREAYAANGSFGALIGYTVFEERPYWQAVVTDAYANYVHKDGAPEMVDLVQAGFGVQVTPIRRSLVSPTPIVMLNLIFCFEKHLGA
ncbi:MAG: hypothetical protein ACRYFY_20135 [Janthinobacterium lividum]